MKITLSSSEVEAVEALIHGWIWMRPPDVTPTQAGILRELSNYIEEIRLSA